MSSYLQSKHTTVTSATGRLGAGALFAAAVLSSIAGWHALSVYGRLCVVLGCVITAVRYYQLGWSRMVLEDDVLLVHDRLRRVRRIPYSAISAITYVKGTVFSLDTDSYGAVWFEAGALGLEDFISALSERILRERNAVFYHGDLEAEKR